MGISFLNHYCSAISNKPYKSPTRYSPITKLQSVKKLPLLFWFIVQSIEIGNGDENVIPAFSTPADKGLVIQLKQGRFFHEDYCLAYQALQDLPAFLLYPQTSDLTSR